LQSVQDWIGLILNNGLMKVKLLNRIAEQRRKNCYICIQFQCAWSSSDLSVSSITKWEENEQEMKPKSNPLHGNLSWR